MKHRIVVDGRARQIDIRPMDGSFVVYRKMYVPPLTRENIGTIAPHDDVPQLERFKKEGWLRVLEEFFRKQIRALGSCAVLAWDGDGVVGKMHFTTGEMYNAFRQAGGWYCVDHESMPKIIQSFAEEEVERLLASDSRTLVGVCFNVGHFDTQYHGKGIASAMVEFLKNWARERGWQRLEMPSCPDIVPFRCVGPQIMRRGWLERRGFSVIQETRVSDKDAAARRQAIETIASGRWDTEAWDFNFYRFNLENIKALASDSSSWTAEYDKDYVMAYDL